MIHIAEGVLLDEKDIKERFVRAAGGGGRHVPRHATAVELSLDLGKLVMPDVVAERLMALAKTHITNDGTLIVVARADRSQHENRKAAHAQLLKLLSRAAAVPKARLPTRPTGVVREKRKEEKQFERGVKRARRGGDDR